LPAFASAGFYEDRNHSADQGVEISRGDLLVLLGKYAEQKNQYHQALIFFQEAAKENPENPSHHLAVGRILRILGRDEEALEELRKTVAIFPESAEAHNEIGVVYRVNGTGYAGDTYPGRG